MTFGDFIMPNWTDLHCVDRGIKVSKEYYTDILIVAGHS